MKKRLISIFIWAACIAPTLGAEPSKLNFVFILVDILINSLLLRAPHRGELLQKVAR